MRPYLQGYDASALTYRWVHPDARVDQLCDEALKLVQSGEAETASRYEIFARLWAAAHKAAGLPALGGTGTRRCSTAWADSVPGRALVLLSRTHRGAGCSVLIGSCIMATPHRARPRLMLLFTTTGYEAREFVQAAQQRR